MNYKSQSTAPKYSFNVETVGNTHTITYKRAKYGIGLFFTLLFVSIIFSIPAFSASESLGYMVLFGGSLGVYLALNISRRGGQFQINDKQIIVDGRSYDLAHVNQIKMAMKASKRDEVILSRPTPGMAVRNNINSSLINHLEKNNYYIAFRYGESTIKLAGGMKKDTAEVLYQRVLTLTQKAH